MAWRGATDAPLGHPRAPVPIAGGRTLVGMSPCQVSVAMCTYNGDSFLSEQLASIVSQSLPPTELVVCDDGSSDGTWEILQAFQQEAPFPVHLRRNEETLGYAQNFGRAIALCTGAFIALSDQDDVWMPEKLRRLASDLSDRPDVGLVCSDAEVVDSDLRPTGQSLMQAIGLTPRERAQIVRATGLDVLLHRNYAMGASMMLRAECRNDVLPIPRTWEHDWWTALIVSLRSRVQLIDDRLLQYRQHGGNAVGAPESPGQPLRELARGVAHPRFAQFQQEAERWEALLDRLPALTERGPIVASAREVKWVRGRVRHVQTRAFLPSPRGSRVPYVARELLNYGYHRYSAGTLSAIKDLFVAGGQCHS